MASAILPYSSSPIPLVRLEALTIPSEPTCQWQIVLSSGGEGVFSGDPSARSEATEDGVEHPLPRNEQGDSLEKEEKTMVFPRPDT
jgi:hypothetical protein